MTIETVLATQNNSATKEEPTPDVSQAVVQDNVAQAEDYKGWLEKASEICGYEMKGDIDPVHKQAENLQPMADSLAEQLGLEDLSAVDALIDDVDEEELNRMDEESRQYNFTAEDVGMCVSNGVFSPALEQAWTNIENCKYNVERLDLHSREAQDLILSIESAGVIDQETAMKLRDRVPGSMDNVNIRMFTKLPSTVGLKLAREGSVAGKIILGGLILAGSIYLIYKILSWTIDGIKLIAKMVKVIRERRRNYKRTHEKVGGETFDPEKVNLEKMAKDLFDNPSNEVLEKMKATGRQPAQLREIKWKDSGDFNKFITPVLQMHFDDSAGTKTAIFNNNLERLAEETKDAIKFTHEILDGVNSIPGNELHAETIETVLNERLMFVEEFIREFSIPITFSAVGSIERVKAVYEWLDDRIRPLTDYRLVKAPPVSLIGALTDIHFEALTDELAAEIGVIRETLNPKAKKTVVVEDTPEQADTRKVIIRDITLTFMALSNVIRSIYHYTVYIESLIVAEDKFINKVKKYTA